MVERIHPEIKDAPKEIYYVASTSTHKIGAVKSVLESLDRPTTYEVEGIGTASEINEQPVGHEEILQGALNRLNNMKKSLRAGSAKTKIGSSPILVSIENGIYNVGDRWFDIAYVVLEDNGGNIAIATSEAIEYPLEFVEEARGRGFASTTVTSIMAEKLQDPSIGTDPHKYLTRGKITRQQFLEHAFKVAKCQLETK